MYLWMLDRQELPEGVSLEDAAVIAELAVPDPVGMAERLSNTTSADVIGVTAAALSLGAGKDGTFDSMPEERHRNPSFVIDYDEAPIVELLDELAAAHDDPSPADIAAFVHGHVTETKYSRGFDLASRVAATQEGDCTEHAVLLAALARASGYPSRVVFGVLLLGKDSAIQSVGHAWTEIHIEGHWMIVDSTTAGDVADAWLRYLPILELTEEGPGFGRTMLELSAQWPSKVTVSID